MQRHVLIHQEMLGIRLLVRWGLCLGDWTNHQIIRWLSGWVWTNPRHLVLWSNPSHLTRRLNWSHVSSSRLNSAELYIVYIHMVPYTTLIECLRHQYYARQYPVAQAHLSMYTDKRVVCWVCGTSADSVSHLCCLCLQHPRGSAERRLFVKGSFWHIIKTW